MENMNRLIRESVPGSSVGIATGYGLNGPGIEFRWGRDFPHLSRPALGPTQPPVQWIPGLSRGLRVASARLALVLTVVYGLLCKEPCVDSYETYFV
jgi:hypothetical protein